MSLDNWELIAKIFQGFATGMAILVGGTWALFRFWSLREIKQVKLRIMQQQRELKVQPVLDLTMTTEDLTIKDDEGHYLKATVHVKNNGSQIARLAYEGKPALRVFAIDYECDNPPSYSKEQELHVRLAKNPNERAKTTIVRPGQIQEIPFLLKLTKSGWYFVSFRAVLSQSDREELIEAGVPEHRIVSWTAKKYHYIK